MRFMTGLGKRGTSHEHTGHGVELNEAEREQLTSMLSGGKHALVKLKRAQIPLAAEAGVSDGGDREQRFGRRIDSIGPSDASWKAIWSWHSVRRRAQGCHASCLVKETAVTGGDRLFQSAAGTQALDTSIFWPARWSGSRRMKGCHARRCAGVWPRTI